MSGPRRTLYTPPSFIPVRPGTAGHDAPEWGSTEGPTRMAARKEPTAPTARPLVGINTDFVAPKNAAAYVRLNAGYVDAVLAAGSDDSF